MNILIVLPTQIFEKSLEDITKNDINLVVIVEDEFYINEKQHKQKLVLLISAIEEYYNFLISKKVKAKIIKSFNEEFGSKLLNSKFFMYEILDKKIRKQYEDLIPKVDFIKNHSIILSKDDCANIDKLLIKGKNRIKHSDFYSYMRKKLNILVDSEGNPDFGKWSFDKENRNKFNKDYKEKSIWTNSSEIVLRNIKKVNEEYKGAYGSVEYFYYPVSFLDAKKCLNEFIKKKLHNFGYYQDAIHSDVVYGEHSNISAIMNIGIITPLYVVKEIMNFYNSLDTKKKKLIISDVEGFVRQIIGWREYMRFTYELYENKILNDNYLKIFDKRIHKSWYSGNTGIFIFDNIIRKVLKYGYLHHIERLMVINNAMIMYNFSQKEIYNWFMRLFVDSYDWVMVSCVCMNHNSLNSKFKYMSRVYISSDSYIKRMSNYSDKQSMEVFNAIYKSFIKNNSDLLKRDYNLSGYISRMNKN
jgi:deoxyribodipyrimidine photolyase-related protein